MQRTRGAIAAVSVFALSFAGLAAAQARPVVVEAEEAVSTNFAPEAVLLYGTGQNRTLQLNQRQQSAGEAFYADLVFFSAEAGEFAFWYGGSLPGSRDQLSPSYGSPFSYSVNDGEMQPVYWEDVEWGDFYSVPYSWVRVGAVNLEAGVNTIRIEVTEKRRYDASFFLYLDRLVLVPADAPELPDYLPQTLRERPESIEDMLIRIREDSQDIEAYLRLAEFYTLLGDNINAIRYLNRVSVLEPNNPRTLLLQARNNVWRGDINSGLDSYWRLLGAAPERLASFLEAGKLAAWSGFYAASEQYYLSALQHHVNNVEVLVNLGFTFLWWNQEPRAREYFRQAEALARSTELVLQVGSVYERNDAAGRAIELYRRHLTENPGDSEVHLALVRALYNAGEEEEANRLVQRAPAVLPNYPEVAVRFEEITRTYSIRNDVISRYEAAVQADPFDLPRRRILAQTYFWIGRRDEGITETENILGIETEQVLRSFVQEEQDLIWRAALTGLVERSVREILQDISDSLREINGVRRDYEQERDREGGDPAALGVQLALLAERLESGTRLAADLLAVYERSVQPSLEVLREENGALGKEMDSIRSTLSWSVPVEQIESEFVRMAANGVPGIAATREVIRTLRNTGPNWEGVLATHAAEEVVRAAAVLTGGVPHVALGQLTKIDAGFTEGSVVFPDMFLVSQLYGEDLESLWLRRFPEESDDTGAASGEEAAPRLSAEDAYVRVDDTIAAATESVREISSGLAPVPGAADELRSVLALRTERALFALQNQTAPLRNQLGTYYLDQDRVVLAVEQFETVLAVDQSNLEARYSLANAYRRLGRWRQAQDEFVTIYSIDPNYRSTVRIHNEIARQQADTFTAGVSVLNEQSRQEARTDLSYLWRVNSNLGLRAGLSYGQYRLRVDVGQTRRHAYQDVEARLGVPLNAFSGRINVEPFAAAYLVGNQLYTVSPAGSPVDVVTDGGDYFQAYEFSPGWGARLTVSRGALFLLGEYEFGPYRPVEEVPPQTALVQRPEAAAHVANVGCTASFVESANLLLSRFDLVATGKAEVIQEDGTFAGTRYFVSQETSARVIDRLQPFTRVEAAASVSFESYNGDESPWFYEPESIFQAGGSAGLRMYRAAGRYHTWGVSTRLYGGLYQTQAFTSDAENGIRVNGNVLAELTRNNVAFQLSVDYNASTTRFERLDYYALTVGLNTVISNFRLLAQ